jgi:TRAP-type mannitol/chloroaromatic compound transport system permease small subunit
LKPLLSISSLIDRINERVGHAVYWLVLVMVLVSSSNAVIRYLFNISSNAWLEVQWYLFATVFLLCAGYTLQRNEHIRIDVLISRLSRRTQIWIDILGTLFFLFPMALLIMVLAWPMVVDSFTRGEMSSDAGGLLRWPIKLMIPLGFLLLLLQGLSELIKKCGILSGHLADAGEHGGQGHGKPAGEEP